MGRSVWVQGLVLIALVAVLVLAVMGAADDWSDWVVLAAIVLTAVGTAVAVNHRQYPTRKRSFTRDSDSRW